MPDASCRHLRHEGPESYYLPGPCAGCGGSIGTIRKHVRALPLRDSRVGLRLFGRRSHPRERRMNVESRNPSSTRRVQGGAEVARSCAAGRCRSRQITAPAATQPQPVPLPGELSNPGSRRDHLEGAGSRRREARGGCEGADAGTPRHALARSP